MGTEISGELFLVFVTVKTQVNYVMLHFGKQGVAVSHCNTLNMCKKKFTLDFPGWALKEQELSPPPEGNTRGGPPRLLRVSLRSGCSVVAVGVR